MATFAMTADGKITSHKYSPVDFTSREDKHHLIRQRSLGDAVLVGHSTLKRDDVRLGIANEDLRRAREKRGQSPYPVRVIVSNEGRIDPKLNIFQTDFGPILIFSTNRMPQRIRTALAPKAILHLTPRRQVNLREMMQTLRKDYGIHIVACEGGAKLFRGLLEQRLVDQLNLTVAPYLFGGKEAPTLTGTDKDFLPKSVGCRLVDMQTVGEECFLTYRFGTRRP